MARYVTLIERDSPLGFVFGLFQGLMRELRPPILGHVVIGLPEQSMSARLRRIEIQRAFEKFSRLPVCRAVAFSKQRSSANDSVVGIKIMDRLNVRSLLFDPVEVSRQCTCDRAGDFLLKDGNIEAFGLKLLRPEQPTTLRFGEFDVDTDAVRRCPQAAPDQKLGVERASKLSWGNRRLLQGENGAHSEHG